MTLVSEDEVSLVRDSFTRLFGDVAPLARLCEQGLDRREAEKARAAVEAMDVFGLLAPEEVGGAGASLRVAAEVARAAGSVAWSAPLTDQMVAAYVLSAVDGALPSDVIAGTVRVGIVRAPGPSTDGPMLLHGDADRLDLVLVHTGGTWRFGRPSGTGPVPALDGRELLEVRLAAESLVEVIGKAAQDAWRALFWLDAATCVGLAQAALQRTLDYVQQRRQFGRTIGSFQAIQHRLADHAVAIDAAALLLESLDDSSTTTDGLAVLLTAAEAAQRMAADAVQFHGGYGFTLEYEVEALLRTAFTTTALHGGWERLLDRHADAIVRQGIQRD